MWFKRSGIAASAVGHLAALTAILIYAEVHPFSPVTTETVKVEIVSPEEAQTAEQAEVPPTPPDTLPPDLSLSAKDASAKPATPNSSAQAAAQAPAAASTKQTPKPATPPAPRPDPPQAAAQPQPRPPPTWPAANPQEPDLTYRYHVALGLPQDKPGDGFDAPASERADLASSLVAKFQRRVGTCAKLPDSIAPTDNIRIKMRVFMTPDGALAADPVLIEASASMKGPVLMQTAIHALQACQPYAMLPRDRYGEWKMLDLSFTPQDFAGG